MSRCVQARTAGPQAACAPRHIHHAAPPTAAPPAAAQTQASRPARWAAPFCRLAMVESAGANMFAGGRVPLTTALQ